MKAILFKDYMKDHLVLLDGAMGTYIYQKGVFIDKCYDSLNLSQPELIENIHRDYLNAGADVIETNTFGANRFKLQKHNLSDRLSEINQTGVALARKASPDGYVAGSMGPLGIEITPWGDIALELAREAFQEQAQTLISAGVDLIILETFQNLVELKQAILAVRDISGLPVFAQMAFQEDGLTIYGVTLEEMARCLDELPIDVIGLNCVLGPKTLLDNLEKLVQLTQKPVSVIPNAGLPQYVDGRMFYMSTPDYFGVYAMRFLEAGARVIGGCCGTTPDHIRKMAEAVAQKQPRLKKNMAVSKPDNLNSVLPEPVPLHQKSGLGCKLAGSDFITLVEMVSPKGCDLAKQISGARKLKETGIDAVNIPDGPRASARMNGMAMAIKLQEDVGIEAVLHYTCRDRNLLGIQSDLLGASVLGIRNILAITGDPPKMGDYPHATAVFDIDSIGLSRFISNLNHGLDIGDKSIGEPTAFTLGVGVDPNSINPRLERDRFLQKMDAGAEFAITQPVFDIQTLEKFLNSIAGYPIPIITGIWPLISLRNAEFMKNEVPGVRVPDALIQRIARFDSKEDQLSAGIEIAMEMAVSVQSMTRGIQVSAPFGRVQIAIDIVAALRKSGQ